MEETILELMDPNDGTHARHQYMVTGGILYGRRLPDEIRETLTKAGYAVEKNR